MAISLGSDARYAQLPASRAGCTAATIPPYSLTFGQIVTGYLCVGLDAARNAALAQFERRRPSHSGLLGYRRGRP